MGQGQADTSLGAVVKNVSRTASFWSQAVSIYASYKATQVKEQLMRRFGASDGSVADLWDAQHQHAAERMYGLCIGLRGFYLKAGQFIGSRADFVPEQICHKLALLCDKVPPMPAGQTQQIIMQQLGVHDLSEVFEYIDLDKPLGSASIAQVHKAKLRSFSRQEVAGAGRCISRKLASERTVGEGESAWEVCNQLGISMHELQRLNKGVQLDKITAGQKLVAPKLAPLELKPKQPGCSGGSDAAAAVIHAMSVGDVPKDKLVAVKVQYPAALHTMTQDLSNLRAAAFYLSKTEIKFDLVSAVDELNKQIRLEFDFTREARVMDTISLHLKDCSQHIQVPRSIPGLVTRQLLVMAFLDGVPLTDAASLIGKIGSRLKREAAKKLILERVSEAYGRMILGEGLFQADGHPGNILIGRGGRIGLLDYGQSKQLTDTDRQSFARLVLALNKGKKREMKGNEEEISRCLSALGVVTQNADAATRTEMAFGMFDTRGKVDPFSPDSPMKRAGISSFPPDLFFVLRVVQLLRGLSSGMGVEHFSCASQWTPFAKAALSKQQQAKAGPLSAAWHFLSLPPRLLWNGVM